MKKSLQQKNSKKILLLICVILIGIFPYNSHSQNAKPKQKPNFIFILIDDLGWTNSSKLLDGRIAI
jgi:hypothetical protein